MVPTTESESRKLLGRLRDTMAEDAAGQARLDSITHLTADSMKTEVCSIYLFRDEDTLELCSTEGLKPEAVHQTRMRLGEGLVGRVAKTGSIVNAADAPSEKGFRYMPETGEEIYSSFLGVPIQRLGETLGVLVVQSKQARQFTADETYALEVVAMVLAEMTELGAFVGEGAALSARHQHQVVLRGTTGQEGTAEGHVWLHEPRVVVTNPIADDPQRELVRLHEAIEELRIGVDRMLEGASGGDSEQLQVLEAYRMFAKSKGWMRRMEEDIDRGLSAEAAVEKEQSTARSRMAQVTDGYLRERLHDLDDLSNRLLRLCPVRAARRGRNFPPIRFSSPAISDRPNCWITGARSRALCWKKALSAAMPQSWRGRWPFRSSYMPGASRQRRSTAIISWSMAIRGSFICAPMIRLSRPFATRWPCRPRRRNAMPRSVTNRQKPSVASALH